MAALAALAAGCGGSSHGPGSATGPAIDPLRPGGADAALAKRAAKGYAHALYARSPGGAPETAARVARFRPLVEKAAAEGAVDPDTLEAIVFLESAGRPEVIAGSDPANAAGLTQILAETGQSLLGMKIDLAASRRLTTRYRNELKRKHPAAAAAALAARRRADDRFVPAKALAATVRYLAAARLKFGRDDLAVVSYHMGIGNLGGVLSAYGGGHPSYAQVFFGSTPLRHAAALRRLESLGDDSATYLWRVMAAEEIMREYRHDRDALERTTELQEAKGSGEEVLHPEQRTRAFAKPGDVVKATRERYLVSLPPDASLHLHRDSQMGELAPRLGATPSVYFALRPQALAVARYVGAEVQRLSGVARPLTITSAVRDRAYQEQLIGVNSEATGAYSLHTTGYAFDLLRRYADRRQAVALQFVLDRLQALNLIAWVREPAAIHITVAGDAGGVRASAVGGG